LLVNSPKTVSGLVVPNLISLLLTFMFLLTVMTNGFAEGDDGEQARGYLLQPGDIVQVSVWKEPDLSRELVISPDGHIALPLVGTIMATSKSVKALNEELTGRLSEYIPQPSVTVSLLKAAGNLYYVVGKVNRPGQYPMLGPTSVLQALSMAGGMTTFANENRVKIIRSGQSDAILFRYNDMADGENLEQNVTLKSGDVVLVP